MKMMSWYTGLFIAVRHIDRSKEREDMITLHPSILEREGKKAFAVLPYEEYVKIREELDNYEDLKDLRKAKAEEGNASVSPLSVVREELSI
jgi:hypothetical protein